MKKHIIAIIVLLALSLRAMLAASPEEEARFLTAAKAAFEKHDGEALAALTCWDRVPDKLKESNKKHYGRDVAQTATDMKVINPDPNFPDLEWKDTDGVSYRSNLPVTKQLKITFAPGGRFKDATYPIGEKDGKLFLLEPAPVK
jgi:hypothetical protein